MNYEKKYKEALETAQKVYHDHRKDRYWREWLTELFPELKESKDKRIRREIIDFLRLPHPQFVGKRDHEKWIAWLEKQDKKLDADKMIEWLKPYSVIVDNIIDEFKKDFGL